VKEQGKRTIMDGMGRVGALCRTCGTWCKRHRAPLGIPSIGQAIAAGSRKGDGEGRATDLAVGGQLPDAVDGETESEGDKAGVGLPV
jgi:hypothetical protein